MIQLPHDFLDTVPLSESDKVKFSESFQSEPPISIRVNPKKFDKELPLEKNTWCSNGFYLKERPVFTFDPIFHSGGYYVQEASSMIIGEITKKLISNHEIKVALDLCAAPGGKTTHLLSALPENSLLIANEVVSSRLAPLTENISKWGNANCMVTNNNPADFTSLENLFDLILVDAPCSGEGMFRKEEAALTEWSLKNVEQCCSRQKNILQDIMPTLKPGGFLIYSTCTYNEKENEENVNFLINEFELEQIDLRKLFSNIKSNQSSIRFFPHEQKGEGFFVAVLRKKESEFSPFRIKESKIQKLKTEASNFVVGDQFTFFQHKENILFYPSEFSGLIEMLKKNLRLIKTGTCAGQIKGSDFIPSHELILSNHFKRDSMFCAALNYENAIRFLSHEALISIPEHKGWGYFVFENFPLGAFKSVPGRVNNYFPKELKIRKKYEENLRFSVIYL